MVVNGWQISGPVLPPLEQVLGYLFVPGESPLPGVLEENPRRYDHWSEEAEDIEHSSGDGGDHPFGDLGRSGTATWRTSVRVSQWTPSALCAAGETEQESLSNRSDGISCRRAGSLVRHFLRFMPAEWQG